jgi:hypothetical protein
MQNLYTKDDTIFVQIASYRDPELQHTLQDLFKKAKRPENIFVGICHQYDMKGDEDKHLFEVPFPKQDQLRIDEVDYRDAQGCCWARNRIQKLWREEKWTLMIDSHMRFEEGWDETAVLLCKELVDQNYRPALTTYACPYALDEKTDKYTAKHTANMSVKFDALNTVIVSGGQYLELSSSIPTPFFSAHFCFADSEIIKNVQYDKLIYFIGEEISMAARLWTLGYDLFVPHKTLVYHLYRLNDPNFKVNRVISTENDALWERRDAIARKRVAHIFQSPISGDEEVLSEIDQCGLGSKRSLRDYERFSGIDFQKRKLREHTKQGVFENWYNVKRVKNIKKIFSQIDA